MIPHARFAKLRLAPFRPDAEIAGLRCWEFLDRVWVGEAVGFSEWLRPEENPEELHSLAIDFSEFPKRAATAVMQAIELPLRSGMIFDELTAVLGEPEDEYRFVDDRITYDFVFRGPPKYDVSCTVLKDGGLTYLVVTVPLPSGQPTADW